MQRMARKVSGSSTTRKPLKAKAMIEKPKKAKAAPTTKILPSPSSVIGFEDNDRVSMLKTRFACTILKAQQQIDATERLKLGREGKSVDKKLPQSSTPTTCRKEWIEATRTALSGKIREAVTPTKTTRIEELRKAARNALEELERSVDIDDSHQSVKNLERLCGWPIPYVGGFKNRMEYYGLYLKN